MWPAYLDHLEHAMTANDSKVTFIDVTDGLPTEQRLQELMADWVAKDFVQLQQTPLITEQLIKLVTAPGNGAISLFIGNWCTS